jgi:hypothetical protein
MLRVVGGVATSGGAWMALSQAARAGQVTDRDPTDPVGRGRGGGTGITDSDSGAGADPYGRGRGGGSRPPRAPGSTGITDSDGGANADPVGRGRGTGGRGNTYSDSDNADPVGNARRPRDGYVDCQRELERLRRIEAEIELSMWDGQRIMSGQFAVERMRAAYAEMSSAREGWFGSSRYVSLHREIEGLAAQYGVSCNGTGLAGCIDQLQDRVNRAHQLSMNRPRLYGERARLLALLQSGNCPI